MQALCALDAADVWPNVLSISIFAKSDKLMDNVASENICAVQK